jgi:uncharacterized membrane protein
MKMMAAFFYQTLANIGYTHPLHPAITHVPLGLVIGAFVFGLVAWLFKRQVLFQTARHCIILALIALLPTLVLGYLDWQYFYAGAWVFPIKMKYALGGLLLILLTLAVRLGRQANTLNRHVVTMYTLCLLNAVAIGYFGGELVYGGKVTLEGLEEGLVREGAAIFNQDCSFCHFADKTENKMGPGLKGLFMRETLPASGRPVTEANIRLQLRTPFRKMPSFAKLPEEKVTSLIAYLKTL